MQHPAGVLSRRVLVVTFAVAAALAACTGPGATPAPSAMTEKSPAPSDAMTEKSPAPSAMTEKSPAPSDAMTEKSPAPSDAMTEKSPAPSDAMTEKSPSPS